MNDKSIKGTVAPGFEAVRDAFLTNFLRTDHYRERGAGFTVYRGNELLVDLHGGYSYPRGAGTYHADTLVNVYSTTKGATAICLALLVDQGLLDYERNVSHYWPEFGANGKQEITVAQALSHQGGLPGFFEPIRPESLFDRERMVSLLAAQQPLYTPGTRTVYHAITYGFIADEIARRVTGSGIRELLETAFQQSLGIDFFIGVPEALDRRVSDIIAPLTADRPVPGELCDAAVLALSNPTLPAEFPNRRDWRHAELPAANGHASANGIARLYSVIANRGSIAGRQFLQQETIAALTRVRSSRIDGLLGIPVAWCAGLAKNNLGFYGPGPETVGHSGWGGSFGCADQSSGLAMGYTCNQMGPDLAGDPRSTGLIDAVYECLDAGKPRVHK